MMELRIDEEFKNLIKPPTDEEYKQLEENILEEGLRDSIIIWGDIIVDGHNRFSICQAHGIEPRTFSKEFESRAHVKEWIIKNQFGRRNLPTHERLRLAMILEESIKERARQAQGTRTDLLQQVGKSEEVHTDEALGEIAGVSRETVRRYRKIQTDAPEEIREKVNTGEITIGKGYSKIRVVDNKPDQPDRTVQPFVSNSNAVANEIDRLKSYYGNLIEVAMGDFYYYVKSNFPDCDPNACVLNLADSLAGVLPLHSNEVITRWTNSTELDAGKIMED